MTDEKKAATKEYVVVFDQLDKHTGEFRSQGVGMPQSMVVESFFRGDKVSLTDEEAKRHLEVGAIVASSDKRAKLVKPNEARSQGVTRDVDQVLPSVQQLEEHEAATAGGTGAKRTTAGGKIGTKAELEKLSVTELKKLAADNGVEVARGDTKPKLAAKLAKVKTADTAAADQTDNPGQGKDESAPPEDQPDAPPDAAESE